MKIDQLIYFIETAKLEHIGKASKILGISTSAISHSIAALEDELGYNLFEKKGKNIILTEKGHVLLDLSQNLIDQFKNLKESLVGSHQDKIHYKIAASHLLVSKVVTPAWAKLSKIYPKITVELISYRSADVVKSILNREMDIGICFSPQSHPEIEMTEVYRGNLHLVVRKSHPVLKAPIKKQIALLNQYPAVLPKAFQGIDLCISHPMFEIHNLQPHVTTTFDSYDSALSMVKQSDSWSLIPDLLINENHLGVTSIQTPSSWIAPYSLSLLKTKQKFTPKFYFELADQIRVQVLDEKK